MGVPRISRKLFTKKKTAIFLSFSFVATAILVVSWFVYYRLWYIEDFEDWNKATPIPISEWNVSANNGTYIIIINDLVGLALPSKVASNIHTTRYILFASTPELETLENPFIVKRGCRVQILASYLKTNPQQVAQIIKKEYGPETLFQTDIKLKKISFVTGVEANIKGQALVNGYIFQRKILELPIRTITKEPLLLTIIMDVGNENLQVCNEIWEGLLKNIELRVLF